MVRAAKRRRTGDLLLGPQGNRHKKEQEETSTTSPNLKQVSFVVPILDESKLIIEEIGMGSAAGPKAQLGSKVTVNCLYISEAGKRSQSEKCDFVLGSSEVMVGLHNGIVGMRPWDKRKITIPASMHHEDRAVCEVTLVKIH